ncbi:MAG: cyclin family protein, partial [Zetaproteobacteria bacterium]|nr:cyclin family protein [Zetaproteobacteria bacterium]
HSDEGKLEREDLYDFAELMIKYLAHKIRVRNNQLKHHTDRDHFYQIMRNSPYKALWRATVTPTTQVVPLLKSYLYSRTLHGQLHTYTLASAIIYMERLAATDPDMLQINTYNFRQIVSVCITLADKFNQDLTPTNSYYAQLAGIDTQRFNQFEMMVFRALNYKLYVTEEDAIAQMEAIDHAYGDSATSFENHLDHQPPAEASDSNTPI